MIPSARPTIPTVAITIVLFYAISKSGMDVRTYGRTDGRTKCAKTMIPIGHDFGLAEWINKTGVINDPLATIPSARPKIPTVAITILT